jgi:hypothetical protein
VYRLVQLEWHHTSNRPALWLALGGAAGIVASHVILSFVPAQLIEFMRRGFELQDLAGVLLLNDLAAIYFPTFFLGLAGALGVVLMARDEHQLEILLVKPVRAADFVTARALPVLGRTLAVGLSTSLVCGLVMSWHPNAGGSVSALGAIGAGAAMTAVSLVLVGVLMVWFVRIREPFHALLVASFLWLMTTMPTAVLLYRPDLYQGRDTLRRVIVLSSLVWHEATLAWVGWVMLAAAVPVTLGLVRLSGWWLARSDAA